MQRDLPVPPDKSESQGYQVPVAPREIGDHKESVDCQEPLVKMVAMEWMVP